ncbi:MAG: flippase-like domain-containing protein [Chloroflexota bacterium]|nr:MAG: flippase-like domain-containing protein [Chloroflexota bacterium]
MKKRIFIAIAVTILIGGLFFWFVDLNQVIGLLQKADWKLLIAAISMLIIAYILLAVRWRYLLGNRPGFFSAFHSVNVSNLVNSLTPIPEIALRVLITGGGSNMSVSSATSGMLVERTLEQVMRVLAFLIALFTGYVIIFKSGSMIINALLIVGFLVLMVLFIRYAEKIMSWTQIQLSRYPRFDQRRIENVISDMKSGLQMAGGPKQLAFGWILSFGIWGAFFVFGYLVLLGLNILLPVEQMVAITLLTLAVAPPSAPGTPGLYQATIVGALSLVVGLNPIIMTAYAIMVHILQIIPLLVLGIWGAFDNSIPIRTLFRQKQAVPVEVDERI